MALILNVAPETTSSSEEMWRVWFTRFQRSFLDVGTADWHFALRGVTHIRVLSEYAHHFCTWLHDHYDERYVLTYLSYVVRHVQAAINIGIYGKGAGRHPAIQTYELLMHQVLRLAQNNGFDLNRVHRECGDLGLTFDYATLPTMLIRDSAYGCPEIATVPHKCTLMLHYLEAAEYRLVVLLTGCVADRMPEQFAQRTGLETLLSCALCVAGAIGQKQYAKLASFWDGACTELHETGIRSIPFLAHLQNLLYR